MQKHEKNAQPSKACSKCGQGEALYPKTRPVWCRPCKLQYNKDWKANNKEKNKKYQESYRDSGRKALMQRARRFGMTAEELENFLTSNQDCAICGSKAEHIDHCHSTGRVRGHLCNGCNKGLGHFKDSQESLLKAVEYLKEK